MPTSKKLLVFQQRGGVLKHTDIFYSYRNYGEAVDGGAIECARPEKQRMFIKQGRKDFFLGFVPF